MYFSISHLIKPNRLGGPADHVLPFPVVINLTTTPPVTLKNKVISWNKNYTISKVGPSNTRLQNFIDIN